MNNVEYEIDLKDLFYRVMKQWRGVIVGAIIIALVAGLFQAVKGGLDMLDTEKVAEAESKYATELSDFQGTGERLKSDIQTKRDAMEKQQEYNEKSVLMQIDPMNKWVGSLVLYIDSKFKIDPTLTYQNIDLTGRLVMAYANYLNSGELYDTILPQTSLVDETRFLREILTVRPDTGSSTVTVECMGESEAVVRELLGLIQRNAEGKYQDIKAAVGDHNMEILTESYYTTIDLNLDATQKKNRQAVSDYADSIQKDETALETWKKTPEPKAEFGTLYIVKQTIKMILLGGVAGIFVMAMLYAMIYALNGRVKTESDWTMMGYRVLARVGSEEKKRSFWKIDRWVDRAIGGRPEAISLETSCKLAANNLSGVLKEKGVASAAVVSDLDETTAAGIVAGLDKAGTGIPFTYAGNVLSDPETVKRLSNVSEVLLLGRQNGTRMEDVQKMKTLLEAWGKTTLGVIVLE